MLRLVPLLLVLGLLAVPALAGDEAKETPATPDEMIQGMEAGCAATAEARAARHEETPLFDRLGGEEGIHALTTEIVRLHMENEAIAHLMPESEEGQARLADGVARWMIMATGGPADAYDGPSLTESHEHLELTNADFLAAGGDIVQAMKNLEYGENEIDEVVCSLVSLRDQVVPEEKADESGEAMEESDSGSGW
jgi:hemoglobin